MEPQDIFTALENNGAVFQALLSNKTPQEYLWKPAPDKWSLLEVVCHLYDEEREDFRARVKHTLETPDNPLPPIDPEGWVAARKYAEQDYHKMLEQFLTERKQSVAWLKGLPDPNWANAFQHARFGPLSARLFLDNWLAHDYLHMRQIDRIQYQYLTAHSSVDMRYAGEW